MADKKEYQFPTEEIDLPSKGQFYPPDNPLSSGKIDIKYMTAKEEDILTSQNLIRKGLVIDKLLESVIVTPKVKLSDMTIGDKNAVMLAARVLGYGAKYKIKINCPSCAEENVEEVDLGGSGGEVSTSRTRFSLEASNLKEVYIMPSISIYDNSAIYVKLGRGVADLTAIGNITGTPGNLTGDLVGFGTIAMTPSGIFIKTEASVTRFNDIKIVGIDASPTAYVEGTPDVVAGTVAIGFKF